MHSFAIHLLQSRYDIRTVQELPGAYGCGDDDDLNHVGSKLENQAAVSNTIGRQRRSIVASAPKLRTKER
jgi:hypothetical protein